MCPIMDGVQPKIYTFSTRALILVHHKVVSQFYQPFTNRFHIETDYDTIQYFNCVVGQIVKNITVI